MWLRGGGNPGRGSDPGATVRVRRFASSVVAQGRHLLVRLYVSKNTTNADWNALNTRFLQTSVDDSSTCPICIASKVANANATRAVVVKVGRVQQASRLEAERDC